MAQKFATTIPLRQTKKQYSLLTVYEQRDMTAKIKAARKTIYSREQIQTCKNKQ